MDRDKMVEIEYKMLKEEQRARIGYRDNMVYLALVAIGGVASFAMTGKDHYVAFLVLPWVNAILGWMYVVNDQKISAIGDYIRNDLPNQLSAAEDVGSAVLFRWEAAHRNDGYRFQRKLIQTVVDLLVFPVAGLVAIAAYFYFSGFQSSVLVWLAISEGFILSILSWQILQYSDWDR